MTYTPPVREEAGRFVDTARKAVVAAATSVVGGAATAVASAVADGGFDGKTIVAAVLGVVATALANLRLVYSARNEPEQGF